MDQDTPSPKRSPKLALHWQILIAVTAGILFGLFAPSQVGWVGWMGTIFLRLLNMVAVPLVFFLIVSSIAEAGRGKNIGILGLKTCLYYIVTTLIAILTGLTFVSVFKPGVGVDLTTASELPEKLVTPKPIGQILTEIVPENIVSAFVNREMLAIVFVSILLGAVLSRIGGEKGDLLRSFFGAASELLMKVTECIILTVPFGIFGMIARQIGEIGNGSQLTELTKSLGLYVATVCSGLAFHMLITLSVILFLFRVRPLLHLKKMFLTIVTAFSTATSNATIPVSLKLLEEEEGVSKETASFVVPLGATVNMNGTSLYECVVVLFLAQAYGMEMSFTQMGVVVLTALLSAIGTAGIPMASLVMITLILGAVGLPLDGLGVVLIVDRFLDMLRTVVNVYGDTCGAVCIAKTEREHLKIDR